MVNRRHLSWLLVGVLSMTACADGGATVASCEAAATHIDGCFGSELTTDLSECTDVEAEQILAQDCDQLYGTLLDTKGDDGAVDVATKAAVRLLIKVALEAGFQAAFEATLATLGLTVGDDMEVYVSFHSGQDLAAAQAKAVEIGEILATEPAYAPVAHSFEDSVEVLHGTCPILQSGLAGVLADVTLEHPSLLLAMGGALERVVNEAEGTVTLKFSIPLSLMPTNDDLEETLGCTDEDEEQPEGSKAEGEGADD